MEMSFAGEEDIMAEVELLLRKMWYKMLKKEAPTPFPRMTYQQAMASYGSDKPDLRFKAQVIKTHMILWLILTLRRYIPSLNTSPQT